jgi:hypothetical protein
MLALIGVVVLVVSGPLRRSGDTDAAAQRELSSGGTGEPGARGREQLDAEREAKYREIRDLELDYRTGKLSREDFESIDGELRAEALAILDRLETPEA